MQPETKKTKKWALRTLALAIIMLLVVVLGVSVFAEGSPSEGSGEAVLTSDVSSEMEASTNVATSGPEEAGSEEQSQMQSSAPAEQSQAEPLQRAPRMAGDVALTSFTIAPSAEGSQSNSTAAYPTKQDGNFVLTVRGVYQITNVAGATDALVEIVLTNKDVENYFTAQGKSYNYFSTSDANVGWPVGSGNQTVTATADGVKVSFTVSGGNGDSGSFTIGYTFDKENFAGWLPNGKLMAEVTTGGDVAGTNLRTVTARATDSAELDFSASPAGQVGAGQPIALSLLASAHYQSAISWRLEPGTDLNVVMEYPAEAQLTLPTKPTYGTGVHTVETVNATTEAIVWEMGKVDENGCTQNPTWANYYGTRRMWYYSTTTMSLVFPNGAFAEGDKPQLKAYFEYTLAGTSTPVRREVTLDFEIVGGYVHMQPLDLTVNGYDAILDIDNPSALAHYRTDSQKIENGGTLPVPNTCFTWYNDVDGAGHKANVNAVRLFNYAVQFQSKMIFYIEGGVAARTVEYYAPASPLGGNRAIYLSAAGVALAAGEYVDKIEVWPLDNGITETVTPATEKLALPLSAGFVVQVYYTSWEGGKFPNGTDIEQGDWTHVAFGLKWDGESKPELHTSATVESKTPASGAPASITMRSEDVPKVFYGRNVIHTGTGIAYQTGESGSKTPGQEFGVNLMLSSGTTRMGPSAGWENPIIYYVPPSYIEMDVTQALEVTGQPGATVTATETTLDGKFAYKIEVTGLTIPFNTTHIIPLTLKVKAGTLPGSYLITSYKGTSGLLFGTSATPHSLYYGYTPSGNYYTDTNDLDNNADFWNGNDYTPYLKTANGPTLVVSTMSKMDVVPELNNNVAGEWQNVNTNTSAQATVATSATGKGEFRLIIANSGNTYLGNIRLLDILPFVGDATTPEGTALSPGEDKDSEWAAVLKNELKIIIYDVDGNDVTNQFSGWDVQYSTNGNPNYNGGAGGIVRTGGAGTFSNNGNYANAKSFLFLSNTFRLPPGYQLVIQGTVAAPEGVTAADAGKVAYNSFAAQAHYYTETTGNAGMAPAGVTQPTKQKFILVDGMDGAVTKSGFVFKDLDHDGVYTAGTDVLFEGVTVQLWCADASGNPTGTGAVSETDTDQNGQYEFTDLNAGDYVVKVIKPSGDAYLFAAQGADSDASRSHVNSSGVGSKFTLTASGQLAAPTNAGIQAASSLVVEFREGSSTGTLLKTVTVAYDDATYSAYASPLEMANGSVTAGTAPFTLPEDYQLQDAGAATQSYALTWDEPSQTVVFVVTKTTYALSYVLNGSTNYPTSPASIASENLAWDSKITEAAGYVAAPTRNGYTFDGWYTDSDFAAASKVDANTVMPKAATTLYAKWTVVNYTISYDYAGGTAPTTANPTSYTVEDLPVSIVNEPTKTSYNFAGWTGSNGTTAQTTVTIAAGDYGNKNYTANWTAINYTISYDYDGGTAPTTANPTSYTVENLPLSIANAPTKDGYEFAGWTGSNGTTAALTVSLAAGDYGNKSYTANWTAINYTISYDYDGGTAPTTANPTGYTVENLPVNIVNEPTKAGYDFAGWTGSNGATAQTTVTLAAGDFGNKNYVANWTAADYTVSFDGNGADGGTSVSDITVTYLTSATLPANTYTRTNHSFEGWATTAGGAVEYADLASYTQTETDDVTLYAVWKLSVFTVRFEDGDGNLIKEEQVNSGDSATPPTPPERYGYIFKGWNGNYTNVQKDELVVAVYQRDTNILPETVTVTFDYNDGRGTYTSVTVSFGDGQNNGLGASMPANPSGNSVFNGWNRSPDGNGAGFTASTSVTSNITVYAQWGSTSSSSAPSSSEASTGVININSSSNPPASESQAVTTPNSTEQSGGSPTNIVDRNIPLFGFEGGTFSLLNLVMSVVALVMAFVMFVRGFGKRKQGGEDEEFEENAGRNRWGLPRVFAVLSSLLPGVLFLLLENMKHTMVWINHNTPVIGLMFLLGVALTVIQAVHERKRQNDMHDRDDGDEYDPRALGIKTK